jgi:hypothetical protein
MQLFFTVKKFGRSDMPERVTCACRVTWREKLTDHFGFVSMR